MKKHYLLLFILLSATKLYSQVQPAIEAIEIPGDHYQFVNKNTRVKVNDLLWEETEPFVNGFAKVFTDHHWNFIDLPGNPLSKTGFESVRNFSNHFAAIKQNGKWGFINEKGIVVIPVEYDIAYDFTDPVTAVYKNNKWCLINTQGIIVKILDIDIFYGFKNGTARVSKQGRQGKMNIKGEILSMETEKKNPGKKTNSSYLRTAAAPCPDNIGFEDGNFNRWNCFIGDVAAIGTSNVITVSPSSPTANRHVIYQSSNPSAIDPYGLFPINPPDGSGYALKLGNNVNGAEAERVSYQINVPANSADASITYRYAVVFQDPGHLTYQQPRFSAKLLDVATNTYMPCASYEYVSTSSLPGFNNSPVDDSVKFKGWASVFINLSAYAGRTLILEFTTADCTRGAHWGYAYVDVGDCNITANIEYNCNPSMATLSGPPGFEFYNWFDNGFTTMLGSGQNIVLTPAPPINSTIHVEVIPFNGFGCSDTLEVLVKNTIPVANAGPDKTICGGTGTYIGNNTGATNTYSWSPSTFLSNPNIAIPSCFPPVSSTYIVTVYNPSSGCTDKDTVTVNINPKPVSAFSPGIDQCLNGNSFHFTNTSSISSGSISYAWNFGDGNTSTQTSPVYNYTNAGAFPIKLVVTSNGGCKDSITHTVTVNPNPVVHTNNDISICRGSNVQLQATGAQTYDWTPATGLSCNNCANPLATPAINSTYIVKGTTAVGCPGFDTISITVFQPIQIDQSPDRAICNKDSIRLQATGAASYAWSPVQGLSSSTIANPVATPTTTTQYRVIGFDGHNCFTDTGYINITVNPKPAIELGPDLNLSTGTVYPFTPLTQNGPINYWQWSPATDLSCIDCPDPSATIKKDITYYVNIRNIYGCVANDSIRIKTFCEGSQVFIPNAFTPDGDGRNDILMVRAKGIQSVRTFRIFTRWGELVFEKTNFQPNDPSFGWDGKIKGVTGAAEVYVYTAEVICDNLQTYLFKGNTTLLK